MMQALHLYRSGFKPSKQLDRPYAMLGVNVVAAATDAEARRLFTSHQQALRLLRRGTPDKFRRQSTTSKRFGRLRKRPCRPVASLFGRGLVHDGGARLHEFIEVTKPDELMMRRLFTTRPRACDLTKSPQRSGAVACGRTQSERTGRLWAETRLH